jgi:hypothetical protein
MTPLEEAFIGRAVYWHGLFLYDQATALAFLSAHQEAQAPLLGVDAFLLDGETIQPLLQHSLDVSSASFAKNPYDAARQIIQQSPASIHFEFTCP